jgi:hypothetical protein
MKALLTWTQLHLPHTLDEIIKQMNNNRTRLDHRLILCARLTARIYIRNNLNHPLVEDSMTLGDLIKTEETDDSSRSNPQFYTLSNGSIDIDKYCAQRVITMGTDAQGVMLNGGILPTCFQLRSIIYVVERTNQNILTIDKPEYLRHHDPIESLLIPGHYNFLVRKANSSSNSSSSSSSSNSSSSSSSSGDISHYSDADLTAIFNALPPGPQKQQIRRQFNRRIVR